MSDKTIHRIMAVDDEEGILKALKRLFKQLDIELVTFTSGHEALQYLKNNSVAVVISDQRMPEMTGIELLSKVRSCSPDCVRILLTGYTDIDTTIDAINRGALEYYMQKPWDDKMFLSKVKECLNMHGVLAENRRLSELTRIQNEKLKQMNENLEARVEEQTREIKERNQELHDSFMETIKSFSTMIEYRSKDVGSHSHRVAFLVRALLQESDIEYRKKQDMVIAAFLHDIGKICIPDKILQKKANYLTTADDELIRQHVIIGQSCVLNINGMEEVGLIIRHHHENFDGSGYPDRQSEMNIPLGSRLIRIANAFDHRAFVKGCPDSRLVNQAMAHLVKYSGTKFDPEFVKKFVELDIGKAFLVGESAKSILVEVDKLEPGMTVAQDVYTHSRIFLLPKGAKLSRGMIQRLTNINKYDPIEKGVYIHNPIKEEIEYEEYVSI